MRAITPMSCVISATAASVSLRKIFDQIEHLRLHRRVERRGRFVGDQQRRLGHHRHGDHHALAHAAGEFVRILREPARRFRNAHALEPFDRRARARPRLCTWKWCASTSPICASTVMCGVNN